MNEEKLREMFSPFGKIVRLRLMKGSGSRDQYGVVQFDKMEDCERALEKYKDFELNSEWKLRVWMQERRTSSLSEEPTNLYVRNIPKHWSEETLRRLFQEFGTILQCRITNDGIAFVRLDSHFQATKVF
ncbi:RNA binding protein, partial [Reticulomyxa filosa]